MILYAIRFDKINKKDICEKTEFENIIDKNLIEQLDQPEKFQFVIELQKSNNTYHEINSILSNQKINLDIYQ